jgi:hypothetical protein
MNTNTNAAIINIFVSNEKNGWIDLRQEIRSDALASRLRKERRRLLLCLVESSLFPHIRPKWRKKRPVY